jgi:hypothetical protein
MIPATERRIQRLKGTPASERAEVRPGASCLNLSRAGRFVPLSAVKPGMHCHAKQSGTAEPPSLMHFREEVF